jgi:hypothetical protein
MAALRNPSSRCIDWFDLIVPYLMDLDSAIDGHHKV